MRVGAWADGRAGRLAGEHLIKKMGINYFISRFIPRFYELVQSANKIIISLSRHSPRALVRLDSKQHKLHGINFRENDPSKRAPSVCCERSSLRSDGFIMSDTSRLNGMAAVRCRDCVCSATHQRLSDERMLERGDGCRSDKYLQCSGKVASCVSVNFAQRPAGTHGTHHRMGH